MYAVPMRRRFGPHMFWMQAEGPGPGDRIKFRAGFPGPQFAFGGPGGPWGRRKRMRRGDVRAALLVLLGEEPRNGYGLMQEIERRSDGVWRPSPGSVYPALQQLEDEGLVRSEESDGRRVFVLTDEGRAHVDENREAYGEPWADVGRTVDEGAVEMRDLLWQTGAAAMQVMQSGNQAQVARARELLAETRRSLYRILADDAAEAGPEGEAD